VGGGFAGGRVEDRRRRRAPPDPSRRRTELDGSLPFPFLVVLVFWLSIIFASFGLYAPRNATVVATLCACALSLSGAIFLILELDRPFEGILRISGAPLQNAIAQLGQ
jgi:hypothetical protein